MWAPGTCSPCSASAAPKLLRGRQDLERHPTHGSELGRQRRKLPGRGSRAGFLEEGVGKIRAWERRIRAGAARLGVVGHGGLLLYPCASTHRVLLHPSTQPSTDPFYTDLSEQDLPKPFPHQLELPHPRMG